MQFLQEMRPNNTISNASWLSLPILEIFYHKSDCLQKQKKYICRKIFPAVRNASARVH